MNFIRFFASLTLVATAGCLGGGGGGGGGAGAEAEQSALLVQPSDPNALSDVLVIPGASTQMGQLPQPSVTESAPTVELMAEVRMPVEAGGAQARVPLSFAGQAPYTECLVQVPGADSYFSLNDNSQATSGMIELPIEVPSNVASGSFCVSVCLGDANGNYSNVVEQCFDVSNPREETSSPGPGATAGMGGTDQPEPTSDPGTTNVDVPQECAALIDSVAVPSVGPCYDRCIDSVFECLAANNCTSLPTSCTNPYIDCVTACAQQGQ